MATKLASALPHAYFWYDFFGVPQLQARGPAGDGVSEMILAVDSIPAYIAKSSVFLVLAPSVYHEDSKSMICSKGTWQLRGWCRLELALHALLETKGLEETCAIFIHHQGFIQESIPMQWLYTLPFKGEFTVKTDRDVVEKMVAAVARVRLERLRLSGSSFDHRFFQAIFRYISPSQAPEQDLDKWMQRYRFGSISDVGDQDGWGCMHLAAVEGNTEMLAKLAAKGAAIDVPAHGSAVRIMAVKGLTPLMAAAKYIPDSDINMATCTALLALRASAETRSGEGQTVLHFAAASPCGAGILRHLLEAKADIHQRDDAGETPLMAASLTNATMNCARSENLRIMLEHGAKWDVRCGGLDAMPWTFIGTSGAEDCQLFLDFKADPNAQLPPSEAREATRKSIGQHQETSVVAAVAVHGTGLTTLMIAAWLGNWETVQVLLNARADPSLQTSTGRRAIDWLTAYGVHSGHTYETLEAAMQA